MLITRVNKNYQITLPRNFSEEVHLSVGDYIEIERQEGHIVIKPIKEVHSDEEYFYSKEWQEKRLRLIKILPKTGFLKFLIM